MIHSCLFVVQSLSHAQLFATTWTAAHQASLPFTISQSLLRFMSIESVMPSNHLIFCLLSSCPQSFPASGSFPISQIFASSGQSIGASASASVLPKDIHDPFYHQTFTKLLPYVNVVFTAQHGGSVFILTAILWDWDSQYLRKQRFTQVRWLDKESKQQSQDWNPSHLNSLLFSFLRVSEPPRLTWSWDTLKAGDKSEARWVLGSLLTLSISPHSVFPFLHSPLPTSSSSPPISITLPYKTAYNLLME